jgi:hypothetical protein
MPQDTTIRWISLDLSILRVDDAPLTDADIDQVTNVVVRALELAGYDACGTTEICETPPGVIVTQIQEICDRLLARMEAY